VAARVESPERGTQESTGITTIDEMVTAFVTSEDRNYAVLTMINDLNQVRAGPTCVAYSLMLQRAASPSVSHATLVLPRLRLRLLLRGFAGDRDGGG